MKFGVKLLLFFVLTLVVNTGFAASSSVVNPPIETTTGKVSFKEKVKTFYQKQIVQRVKKKIKKVKDSWNLYKEAKKKRLGFVSTFILLLTATFVTLQLVGVISWPWIWVLAPLWIPIALAILLLIIALIGIISIAASN